MTKTPKRRAVAFAFALTIAGQVSITPVFATPDFVESWSQGNGPSLPAGNSGNVPPPFRDSEVTAVPPTRADGESAESETVDPTTSPETTATPESPSATGEESTESHAFRNLLAVPATSSVVDDEPAEEVEAEQVQPSEPVVVDKPVPLSSAKAPATKPQRSEARAPHPVVTEQPAKPEPATVAAVPTTTEKYEPAPRVPGPLLGTVAEPAHTPVDPSKPGNVHPYRNTGYSGSLSPSVAIASLALFGLTLIGGVVFTIGSSLTFRND